MYDGHISPIERFFRNKWVRIVLGINVVIVIALIVAYIIDSKKTAVLELDVVPLNSQISVNGDTNFSNGKYRMFPGVYEIEVSYPDLDSKTFTVDLSHQDAALVATFLSRNDDFYHYRKKGNYDDFMALARIASANHNQTTDRDASAEDFIADYQRNYYLYTNQLPATYTDYDNKGKLVRYVTVRSSDSCDILLCLEAVLFDEKDKQLANSLLEGKGFNMKDFEIKYEVR